MKKRILATLLCFYMILTLLPTEAFVAGNGKAILSGTGMLETGANTDTAATVYYGKDASGNPYAWRVIGYDGTGAASTSGSITMLAADNLGHSIFKSGVNNHYSGSTLQTEVDKIVGRLKPQEQDAIAKRTLAVQAYSATPPYSNGIAGAEVADTLLWPLSTAEAYEVHSDLRRASHYWWLRSPGYADISTAIVYNEGGVDNNGVYVNNPLNIRPAFHLNLNTVLFTSAAEGGKVSGAVGAGALNSVSDYPGNEWKLTLKDTNRSGFRARISGGGNSATVAPGGSIKIDYLGAATGANEYISAMITDTSGKVMYYGNIANNMVSDMAQEITIPAALPAGSYMLKIFNEQLNGDKKTDYSSGFQDIVLTVSELNVDVKYTGLTANGSDTATTTVLTLTFDKDIPGLSADDINIIGANKGTLTKKADTGVYTLDISDIKVSDQKYVKVSVDKVGYTFTPASRNATVRVYTPPTSYTIQVSASPAAYGSVTGGGSVTSGSTVTLRATPNSGFHFVKWTEGGADVSTTNPYTFTASAHRTLVAVFETNSSGGGGGSTTPDPETVYRFTEGAKSTWKNGETDGLSFTCEGAFSKFQSLTIDSVPVAGTNYTVKSGSTIVTFQPEYLKTLSVGSHTLRLIYSDGYAQTTFTIVEADKQNPNTSLANPFTDVSQSDWFYDNVMFVYGRKIMAGTSSTTFSPHNAATRGMMATILWRMEGSPAVTGKSPYTDVASGKYYTDAVIWTTQKGIFSGYGDKTFRAEESITREQLAAIFYQYAKYKGYNLSPKAELGKFRDKDDISDWAKEAMQWAVGSGLINGKGTHTLDPKGTATRAEIAAILHRFIGKYELVEGIAPGGQMGWIKKIGSPQTGDSSNPLILFGLMLISAIALAAIQIHRRRKGGDGPTSSAI